MRQANPPIQRTALRAAVDRHRVRRAAGGPVLSGLRTGDQGQPGFRTYGT